MRVNEVRVIGLTGIPEVRPGDDLPGMLLRSVAGSGQTLEEGDILVVTQKAVSKSEGRLVDLADVEASPFAVEFATRYGKDARHVEIVLRESARVVRMDRGLIIAETKHGLVCANAGVDASNVAGDSTVCLLPEDPDASAERLRAALRHRLGLDIPIIITDSFGRPWREGITNVAIGLAGLAPLIDYRGHADDHGQTLNATVLAVADELAAASELVMGKLLRIPAAIVRGYQYTAAEGSARALRMDPARDMFR